MRFGPLTLGIIGNTRNGRRGHRLPLIDPRRGLSHHFLLWSKPTNTSGSKTSQPHAP